MQNYNRILETVGIDHHDPRLPMLEHAVQVLSFDLRQVEAVADHRQWLKDNPEGLNNIDLNVKFYALTTNEMAKDTALTNLDYVLNSDIKNSINKYRKAVLQSWSENVESLTEDCRMTQPEDLYQDGNKPLLQAASLLVLLDNLSRLEDQMKMIQPLKQGNLFVQATAC